MKVVSRIAFVCVLSSSLMYCGIHTHFSKEEVDFLNAIGREDTMVFSSSTGSRDTFFLTKPKFYYPEYIPIEVHGKWLPQECIIYYTNRVHGIELREMLSASKYHDRTSISIAFLNGGGVFYFTELNRSIDGLTEFGSNSYQLSRPTVKGYHVAKLRITIKDGIVGYTTVDGEVWKRVK